ncbi:MAG TPA: YeeE/YedE thiosulfate transporter family protein, partial [Puia sp.]|nr:YeeE/YedE thiosulfate transporter family protein [Puia sp.]
GLMVPTLLIMGNKNFGISSSLRHVCAAIFPSRIPFFQYNWKREIWNLFFVTGIILGGFIGNTLFKSAQPPELNPALIDSLKASGIHQFSELMPRDLFNWQSLLTLKGSLMIIAGGFMVGFGTRYAGGCTSGHSIMGLSNLQFASLIATCCFMIGGFVMSNLILPYILRL